MLILFCGIVVVAEAGLWPMHSNPGGPECVDCSQKPTISSFDFRKFQLPNHCYLDPSGHMWSACPDWWSAVCPLSSTFAPTLLDVATLGKRGGFVVSTAASVKNLPLHLREPARWGEGPKSITRYAGMRQ